MTLFKGIKESFTYDRPEFPASVNIIFQIILIVATTWVTMIIVPNLTQEFERHERKSEFYSSIINELNGDTKDVLGKISILSKNEISADKREDIYIDVSTAITKLHWRSVEFAIVFENTEIEDEIQSYQKSLSEIENALYVIYKEPNTPPKRDLIENFTFSSAKLLQALAKEADIVIKKNGN